MHFARLESCRKINVLGFVFTKAGGFFVLFLFFEHTMLRTSGGWGDGVRGWGGLISSGPNS